MNGLYVNNQFRVQQISFTLLLLFVFILFEHHVSEFVKLTSFGL